MFVRSAMFTPTVCISSHGGKLYTKLKVYFRQVGSKQSPEESVILKWLCEVNSFVENVFQGSSLRSASKLQEETSKGHIFVVIFNISLSFLNVSMTS